MKRTYEKKSAQPVASVKTTTLNLQTRGFALSQPELDEGVLSQPRNTSSENLLEKLISTSKPKSALPIQRKSQNRLKEARMPIQAKLNIGEPNDKYEKEADDTASKVVQQINSPTQDKPVQRQESMEEENEELQMKPISSIQRDDSMEEEELQMKSLVQRRENLGGGEAPTDLESSIQSARGGGQSLDAGLQTKMGQALRADFSGVKVHTGSQSDQLNQSIQAKAFTTGQDVFFRQGAYNPSSKEGQELIAHELTHVVQQSTTGVIRRDDEVKVKALKDLGANYNVFLMEVDGEKCVMKFQGQKSCQEEIMLGLMGKIIGLEYTEPKLVKPGEGDHQLYVDTIKTTFKIDPTASNGSWLMIMPMEKFHENQVCLSEVGFEKYGMAYAFDLFTYGRDKWNDDMLSNLFVSDTGNFIMLDTNTKLNGTQKMSDEGTARMKERLSRVTRKKYFEFAMKSAGKAADDITKSQRKELKGAFLKGIVKGMEEILKHSDEIIELQAETSKRTKELTGKDSPSGFISDLDMNNHLENLSKVLKSKSSISSEGRVYKFVTKF
ncbi:MAG: hypothetical protein DCF19_19815 [Pseudanabaena frigida]|uniref:eCIS core domain-containing protein n=1 Tax=Pseudanabaena frigida TaxID=945775 RepID=A0A2W4VW56_9CYAN|nr:MAG: hypothetical protein DCF19_19815 [Pseudanabaena frigida]